MSQNSGFLNVANTASNAVGAIAAIDAAQKVGELNQLLAEKEKQEKMQNVARSVVWEMQKKLEALRSTAAIDSAAARCRTLMEFLDILKIIPIFSLVQWEDKERHDRLVKEYESEVTLLQNKIGNDAVHRMLKNWDYPKYIEPLSLYITGKAEVDRAKADLGALDTEISDKEKTLARFDNPIRVPKYQDLLRGLRGLKKPTDLIGPYIVQSAICGGVSILAIIVCYNFFPPIVAGFIMLGAIFVLALLLIITLFRMFFVWRERKRVIRITPLDEMEAAKDKIKAAKEAARESAKSKASTANQLTELKQKREAYAIIVKNMEANLDLKAPDKWKGKSMEELIALRESIERECYSLYNNADTVKVLIKLSDDVAEIRTLLAS